MSKIAMPEMRRHGYSEELAAGSIGVGATLDILIPPSIAMVIYGIATQTSIGKLLVAGVVPGIVVGILLAAMIYLWVTVSPQHAPETYRVAAKERRASLGRVWPSLLLIVIVLVLLYTGIATPTEIGALGALMAAIIGAAFGRLTVSDAIEALKSTIRTSAMIFLILIGATIFGYYMALSRIPQSVVIAVTAMDLNRWVVIVGIVVAYFVISMFMDEIPLLLLTLQLTFPLITSLGFDPIWFGVLSMMMVAMGLVFPPVGLIAFVVSATAGVNLMKVYKGTSILMLALVITTILLMIFPQIALWLPATMR
jgi:tripartite ATP-independent transporter DctM subunit